MKFFPRTPNCPLVSVLMPTRGRPAKLVASVDSLYELAEDPSRVQVLAKADEDDTETIDTLAKLRDKYPFLGFAVGARGRGYPEIHLWLAAMAAQTTGDWIFVWNDDAVMETKNWDGLIDASAFSDCWHCCPEDILFTAPVCQDNEAGFDFFIMRRRAFEVLGHLGQSPYADAYLARVFNMIGSASRLAHVKVRHERDGEEIRKRDPREIYWGGTATLNSVPGILTMMADVSQLLGHIAVADGATPWLPSPSAGPGWYHWRKDSDTRPLHVLLMEDGETMLVASGRDRHALRVSELGGQWRPRGER